MHVRTRRHWERGTAGLGARGILVGLGTAGALAAVLGVTLALRAHGGGSAPHDTGVAAAASTGAVSASTSEDTGATPGSVTPAAATTPAGFGTATASSASAVTGTLITPQTNPPPTPTPTPVPPNATRVTLTEADSGRSISVHGGTTIVVGLAGSPSYAWTEPATSNAGVVARVSGAVNADGSATATFDATAPGSADLTATDNPRCYPQCLPPSRLWRVAVTVVP